MVRCGEVDAAAVIGALVEVEVVLILTAKLNEVVPLQLGDVIAKEVVMAVPETGSDVLGIDVVRSDYRG